MPVDLQSDRPVQLVAAGMGPTAPAISVAEGLSMYLSEDENAPGYSVSGAPDLVYLCRELKHQALPPAVPWSSWRLLLEVSSFPKVELVTNRFAVEDLPHAGRTKGEGGQQPSLGCLHCGAATWARSRYLGRPCERRSQATPSQTAGQRLGSTPVTTSAPPLGDGM